MEIFARSNTEIVGSHPTRGMDVCVRLFCVCVVLCICSGLEMGRSPVQGVLPIAYYTSKLKRDAKAQQNGGSEWDMWKRHKTISRIT
jgi:hypothetical protein